MVQPPCPVQNPGDRGAGGQGGVGVGKGKHTCPLGVSWLVIISVNFHNNPVREVLLLTSLFQRLENKVKKRNHFWSLLSQDLSPNLSDSTDYKSSSVLMH